MNNHKIISEGNRPLWQLIFAAFFFASMFVLIGMFFYSLEFATEDKKFDESFRLIQMAIFAFTTGLGFCVVTDIVFDLKKKTYKIQYCVGPIRVGKWNRLPEIEYVSVFRQLLKNEEYIFEVNLWYDKNRHFNIYKNLELDITFEFGKHVSEILEVDLLDATVPNDFKWVK